MEKFELIVVGGGVSGTSAAVAAARHGIKTLLIEQNGYLGGTLTGCGVGPMMTFFAGEKQIIQGIMQEIVIRMQAKGFSCGHTKDTTGYISYLTPFSAEGLKLVLDEMVQEAGCTVLFHTFAGGVYGDKKHLRTITVCNKKGLTEIAADYFIDATADGDLIRFLGMPVHKGREKDGKMQPLTMMMKVRGVDTGKLRKYIRSHLEDFPRLQAHTDLLDGRYPLAVAGFLSAVEKGRREGRFSIPREDILLFETDCSGEFILNTSRIPDHDATDAISLSKAEIEGRKQCRQLFSFLKNEIPGFTDMEIVQTGPSVGVRESVQIIGKYTLTKEDVIERKKFASAIAHADYPIDIHSPDGLTSDTTYAVDVKRRYYDIPYEIMVPKSVENLLVTGRCASMTFEAQAALRVSPIVGAMGQAAGTAIALAVKEQVPVGNIDVKNLQKVLVGDEAYLDV